MKGTAKVRYQGYGDPLLVEVMKAHGFEKIPLYEHRPAEDMEVRKSWRDLAKLRDGPISEKRRIFSDLNAAAEAVKAKALALGADDVGIARLTPAMINDDSELSHEFVICLIVGEEYEQTIGGPRAIETEAMRTYQACAEISTELAEFVRELGYHAIAHHNGACNVQAIPAMYAAGLGELGKHGSLVHPELGASHRPGFVTTTLPLATDAPYVFGVQDTCLHCNLCTNNCPGDAIPAQDFIVTEGVRRWVTDVAKCYVYSRLRAQYCHICVDVCPYVHKANGDAEKKLLYKDYMSKRKKAGYKAPAWFPDEETAILASEDEVKKSRRS
jgi:epoxyqueuosine reductase